MNYYDIIEHANGETCGTWSGVDAEAAFRLFCFEGGYNRDELDIDDYLIKRVDITDITEAHVETLREIHAEYNSTEVSVTVDEENNSETWWEALPVRIASRLHVESPCILSLDELFDLMNLPGWYDADTAHAPNPLLFERV